MNKTELTAKSSYNIHCIEYAKSWQHEKYFNSEKKEWVPTDNARACQKYIDEYNSENLAREYVT